MSRSGSTEPTKPVPTPRRGMKLKEPSASKFSQWELPVAGRSG